MKPFQFVLAALLCVALSACVDIELEEEQAPSSETQSTDDANGQEPATASARSKLKNIDTWMYQIQALNDEVRLEALAETEYPLLVLEPGFNFSEYPYDAQHIVDTLRTTLSGKQRILLAYVDIGQAEDYRDYWQDTWVAPTDSTTGHPAFLLAPDPDNWSGNYQVAYWEQEWKDLWLASEGIISKIAAFGFDGIYMDWVEAYDDVSVQTRGIEDDVNVEIEMIKFIEELGAKGRSSNSEFLVVAQNAPYLIDEYPERYAAAIDALAVEDTWFHGDGDEPWESLRAGDLKERHEGDYTTENRLLQYKKFQAYGLPVFSADYCLDLDNAALVYAEARKAGLIPLVTRVPLDRLTVTPPEDFD